MSDRVEGQFLIPDGSVPVRGWSVRGDTDQGRYLMIDNREPLEAKLIVEDTTILVLPPGWKEMDLDKARIHAAADALARIDGGREALIRARDAVAVQSSTSSLNSYKFIHRLLDAMPDTEDDAT